MAHWRGQEADISVKWSGSGISIGVLQDIEITTDRSVEQLRGSGSVKWQDLQQTEVEVSIAGEVMAWDYETYQELADADSTGITDDSETSVFEVIASLEDTDGNTYKVKLKDGYVEDVPASGSYDDWIGLDLEFTGINLVFTKLNSDGTTTLTIDDITNGDIEVNGSIVSTPYSATFGYNTIQTVEVIPDSGYQFVEWQGDVYEEQENNNPVDITMDAHKNLKAVLEST